MSLYIFIYILYLYMWSYREWDDLVDQGHDRRQRRHPTRQHPYHIHR
jgi:hypothetical protein